MAERGDGHELLGLYESFVSYGGRAPHLYDALLAVGCLDDPGSTDPAAIDELNVEMKAKAPTSGPRKFVKPPSTVMNTSSPECVQ